MRRAFTLSSLWLIHNHILHFNTCDNIHTSASLVESCLCLHVKPCEFRRSLIWHQRWDEFEAFKLYEKISRCISTDEHQVQPQLHRGWDHCEHSSWFVRLNETIAKLPTDDGRLWAELKKPLKNFTVTSSQRDSGLLQQMATAGDRTVRNLINISPNWLSRRDSTTSSALWHSQRNVSRSQ